jgi:methylmalonyl-CoA mutase N-terminal domain/subunit
VLPEGGLVDAVERGWSMGEVQAEQRDRQRRFDEEQMRRRGEASGSSSSTGV